MTDEAKQALDPEVQPAWAIEATIAVAEYLEDLHGIEISAEDGMELNRQIRLAVENGRETIVIAGYLAAAHDIELANVELDDINRLVNEAIDRYPGL